MAYAGFFINLRSIPPVLRWLQWLAPLKYALEAVTINEVGAGLMIVDELAGAKVQISAEIIMQTLCVFRIPFASLTALTDRAMCCNVAASASSRAPTTATSSSSLRSSSALPSSSSRPSLSVSANCARVRLYHFSVSLPGSVWGL